MDRDIIIIAGPFASGKTFAANKIRQYMEYYTIPYESKSVSDAQTLLKRVKLDDVLKGFHHFHPWQQDAGEEHNHRKKKEIIPFTTSSNLLVDGKYYDFFQKLSSLPITGKIWVAEWAGGVNSSVPENSPLHYNYSFEKIVTMLQLGIFPTAWFSRVKAIIHPVVTKQKRLELNKARHIPSDEEIRLGRASWMISPEGMKHTEKDDFKKIELIFEKGNIPVYHAINNGTTLYEKELDTVLQTIFLKEQRNTFIRKQTERDIILVAGSVNTGKKTIVDVLQKKSKQLQNVYRSHYVSDVEYVLAKVREDDRSGGFNHYHDWCKETRGHTHTQGKKEMPFVITSNELIYQIWQEYFHKVNTLPYTGNPYVVEWTGGVNINDSSVMASKVDRSFEKIKQLIQRGLLPDDWMQRVYAVIHPFATNDIRVHFMETESIRTLEKIKGEVVSPLKNEVILNVFGKDDFFAIEKLFFSAHVPFIYHFENQQKQSFLKQVNKVADVVIQKWGK